MAWACVGAGEAASAVQLSRLTAVPSNAAFLKALHEICAKKKCALDTLFNKIAQADPLAATTKAGAPRLGGLIRGGRRRRGTAA